MTIIWATRGKHWGHRFLRTGGSTDPLIELEEAFSGTREGVEIIQRRGSSLALRFADPDGRRDAAGRVILHEMVVDSPEADSISTLEEGIDAIWPAVSAEFTSVWDQPTPPSPTR